MCRQCGQCENGHTMMVSRRALQNPEEDCDRKHFKFNTGRKTEINAQILKINEDGGRWDYLKLMK